MYFFLYYVCICQRLRRDLALIPVDFQHSAWVPHPTVVVCTHKHSNTAFRLPIDSFFSWLLLLHYLLCEDNLELEMPKNYSLILEVKESKEKEKWKYRKKWKHSFTMLSYSIIRNCNTIWMSSWTDWKQNHQICFSSWRKEFVSQTIMAYVRSFSPIDLCEEAQRGRC